jgi:hypothetical protein
MKEGDVPAANPAPTRAGVAEAEEGAGEMGEKRFFWGGRGGGGAGLEGRGGGRGRGR